MSDSGRPVVLPFWKDNFPNCVNAHNVTDSLEGQIVYFFSPSEADSYDAWFIRIEYNTMK